MRTIKFIGVAVFVILVTTVCGQNSQKNAPNELQAGWETFTKDECSIRYPDSLTLNTSGMMGFTLFLYFNQTSPEDSFRENISLMIQDLKGMNMTLDGYAELSVNQIKSLITDANIVESKRMASNDFIYHKIIYTGKQGMFDLEFEQYFIIENEKAYLLTFTAEATQFDNYQPVAEAIMNSFKLK